MPSKDRINSQANRWMDEELPFSAQSSDPAKQRASVTVARKEVSGFIQKLAKRTGQAVEDLVARFPSDTIRRTKYPVLEQPQGDGSVKYVHTVAAPEGQRRAAR